MHRHIPEALVQDRIGVTHHAVSWSANQDHVKALANYDRIVGPQIWLSRDFIFAPDLLTVIFAGLASNHVCHKTGAKRGRTVPVLKTYLGHRSGSICR